MTMAIIWIIIDAIMIKLNYGWAKQEEEKGNKRWSKVFTFFFASWILFLGFDIWTLASIIMGG
jgi:hypothetical protein